MSWQIPSLQRYNAIDIDREVRHEHFRYRHIRADAVKCAYVKTLHKVRERCGHELWEELKRHKQAWDEAARQCREEDERERRKNALASDTRKVS